MTNINEYYKASLVADKKSENTIKNYLLYVGKMLAFVNKPVEEISFLDLTAWKASISNLSTASMNIQISAVRNYFKFLISAKVINENPALDLTSPKIKNKEKHYISAEDVSKMLHNCKKFRDIAVIALYCSTGLRFSELTSITFEDYNNMIDNQIVILGKGAKERTIYVNEQAKESIDNYIKFERADGEYLFTSERGEHLDNSNLNKMLKLTAKRAGIPFWNEITNHALRAGAATIANANGVGVATISAMLGHNSIATTTRYIKHEQAQINEAMKGLVF